MRYADLPVSWKTDAMHRMLTTPIGVSRRTSIRSTADPQSDLGCRFF
jgi:hypothetical protein